jgi:hypothetical protein
MIRISGKFIVEIFVGWLLYPFLLLCGFEQEEAGGIYA